MINIADNFNLAGSTKPLDSRDEFATVADMKACTVCNEKHICYVRANQKQYQYSSSNTNDSTTGKWREYTPGGGGGEGTITGATIGGNPVTESGGVLQLPAYPTVPINKIKVDGESSDLPINDGRVVIPQPPVKGIKTNGGTTLTPNNGIVTLPPIPADPSSRLTNIENTLQQIANAEPIVIPSSAVELPTSANSTITYDSDDTYVMNISGTQIATVHYPYEHGTNSYLAFKAIDRDLYYVYQLTNAANNTYTFVEQHTYDELSHDEAKAVFEAGKYAVKQVIDVRHNGNPLPDNYFKHGIPSTFVTPDGYPLRYNQIKENNVYYILLKCDENNKIFKYSASNGKWSLVSGGCYTKDDTITGENYKKYDAYFDRQPASNISFDDTITQLGTQESPVTDVQAAINQLAAGVSGLTGKLKIRLLYQNNTPITDKAVNITVLYRGSSYDISSQYSPNTQGFITDNDGYVINANSNEYILLPLGAQYTIHLYDISNDYITPEDKTGIVDANITTFNFVYENVSNAEMVYFYVQLTNVTPNIATVNNKKIYVDFYSDATTHALQYQCVLRANGTVKQILDASGNQATYNGENLISDDSPVLMPVPIGTKYTCALQEWDESIPSENQRYIKSANVTISAANKAKRTIRFTYKDNQVGIFLVIADSTKSRGYRECLITDVDVVNNEITFVDDSINYKAYLNNSTLYKEIIGTETPELWEETILGYGIRTSTTIYAVNNDTTTQNEYPDCSFFIPKTRILYKQQLLTISQAVSLPQDFGGLFCTRNLYNLTDGQTSPAAHALIDDNLYALTLNTPNSGTNVIKAFIASKSQLIVIQGNKPLIDNISTILTGTTYHTGASVGLWQSNLSITAQTGFDFDLRKSNDYLPFNPTAMSGASTAYYSFIMYPF